jgi:hypothetical protein
MNTLVLKIPKNKPPFIGIRYDSLSSGESANKGFFLKLLKSELRLVIEVLPRHLNVKLICDDTLFIHTYTHVKFDAEKLKNWLYISKGAPQFNFGFTFVENDTEKIIQMWDKKFYNMVLKLKKIEILELKSEPMDFF